MVAIEQQDSAVEIVVAYEGPAVAEHRMPVRDLAPALLALEQAFVRTNALLNGSGASVSLEIRAPRQGSFEIVVLVTQLLDGGSNSLSADFISSAVSIKELLVGGAGATSLIHILKRLRGRRPDLIIREQDSVTLEAEKLRLSMPARTFELLVDKLLRGQIEEVLRPVTTDGIDRVIFREASEDLETVEKGDVPYFQVEVNEEEHMTRTIISDYVLKPATVRFATGGTWRLSDGDHTQSYAIKDTEFLEEVTNGERRFGSTDVLVCNLVITQFMDSRGKLRTEHEVSKVVKHISPPKHEQSQMFSDD